MNFSLRDIGRVTVIVNERHANSVIGKMEGSNFNFYLTGSRFFGGFTPTSDWDYFVKDSPEVRSFLFNIGFYEKESDDMTGYDDSTIVSVFEQNDIHIQLVKDAELKARAQKLLSEHTNMRSIPKTARKYLWILALGMLQQEFVTLWSELQKERNNPTPLRLR